MQTASKNLMETLSDIYEKEWVGQDMLYVQAQNHEMLWADVAHKLSDQVVIPLNTYQAQFPEMRVSWKRSVATKLWRSSFSEESPSKNLWFFKDLRSIFNLRCNTIEEESKLPWKHEIGVYLASSEIKSTRINLILQFFFQKKIDKRGRKLIDFDKERHAVQQMQNNPNRNEAKFIKVKEQMENAKRTYEVLNSELHDELPALHDSRILFLVTNMQTLFAAEDVFHSETAKVMMTHHGFLTNLN